MEFHVVVPTKVDVIFRKGFGNYERLGGVAYCQCAG